MKRTQLKSLVEIIVRRTISEMQNAAYLDYSDWKLNGEVVTIWHIQLPDNRTVSVNVNMEGAMDTGAFRHAFGTHQSGQQYEMDRFTITRAVDDKTNQQVTADPVIQNAVDAIMDDIQGDIVDQMSNQNG